MSMKKFDLAKSLGLKVTGQMKAAGVPQRFAQGAAQVLDRRERRARDAAAGLVPFACKLPKEMVQSLNARATSHPRGLNGLVAELLATGQVPQQPAVTPVPAKKASARKAAPKKVAPGGASGG